MGCNSSIPLRTGMCDLHELAPMILRLRETGNVRRIRHTLQLASDDVLHFGARNREDFTYIERLQTVLGAVRRVLEFDGGQRALERRFPAASDHLRMLNNEYVEATRLFREYVPAPKRMEWHERQRETRHRNAFVHRAVAAPAVR
jgi:hypothetical protein